MIKRGVNTPKTSSAGRLFDAAASILGLCQRASYEGEAAMALELAADRATSVHALTAVALEDRDGILVLDWRPLLKSLVRAYCAGISVEALAAGFHAALADAIAAAVQCIGLRRVLLTGGCFQNTRLTEATLARLRDADCEAWTHHRIPPNDGGLAAGQAVFGVRPLTEEQS